MLGSTAMFNVNRGKVSVCTVFLGEKCLQTAWLFLTSLHVAVLSCNVPGCMDVISHKIRSDVFGTNLAS